MVIAAVEPWYPFLKKVVANSKTKRQQLDIGRTSLQFIKQDVEFSGYQGCRTMDSHFPVRRNFETLQCPYRFFGWNRNLSGVNAAFGNCYSKLPRTVCDKAIDKQDILIIYNIPYSIHTVAYKMNSAVEAVNIAENKTVRQNSLILISDCFQGDIFIANEVKGNQIYHQKTMKTNSTESLSKAYGVNAEVVELQTVAYYLGRTSRQDFDALTYSLYRSDLFHETTEILEGVVDFKVEYFLRTGSLQGEYQSAADIPDDQWPNVLGVRIKVITVENETWEYEFAIRNRHCVNINVGFIDPHFSFVDSSYEDGYWNHENYHFFSNSIANFNRA